MRSLLIAAVFALSSFSFESLAQTQESIDDAASLAEDQRDTAPDEASGGVPSDPDVAAAAAGVLPVINLKPRDPNSLEPGTLCQSKFAQRSPICAAKH